MALQAPSTYRYLQTPNGYCTLRLGSRLKTIIGGPFDAYNAHGIGVCLEPKSDMAPLADILIDVPDFQAPTEAQLSEALLQLIALTANNNLPIYVGCRGGIGRTGTFIAALARLAGHDDPVAWTRTNYLDNAVETAAQRYLVETFDVAPMLAALEEMENPAKENPGLFSRIKRFISGLRSD